MQLFLDPAAGFGSVLLGILAELVSACGTVLANPCQCTIAPAHYWVQLAMQPTRPMRTLVAEVALPISIALATTLAHTYVRFSHSVQVYICEVQLQCAFYTVYQSGSASEPRVE